MTRRVGITPHSGSCTNAGVLGAQVDDRQRRFASLWNQMSTVLKQIMKQRDAAHFSQPVDIEKLKVCHSPGPITASVS